MPREPQGIPIAPLTGVLDLRSAVDSLPKGALRMRQNLQTVAPNKLRRGCGWSKFLNTAGYNNADFHDQLLTFGSGVRQPITLIFESTSTRRVRSLFVATQSKIAKLNERGGNYAILGSGFGGASSSTTYAPRFKAAKLDDYLVFTNDTDKPMYHLLEVNDVDTGVSLRTFDDLDTIGLTRAGCVWAWNNVLIFADVEMDGDRYASRVIWSDYKNPTSFDPAKLESITGYKDLFSHERILAGAPFGNSFLIYTTHGIWEMNVVGGDESFSFVRRFNGENEQGAVVSPAVLKFPNTLIPVPGGHLYGGEDDLYFFSPYTGDPRSPDWLSAATTHLYDSVDAAHCTVHVAGLANNEVLMSFASTAATAGCPDRTLRINVEYNTVDVVDHGFTALGVYHSSDVPTLRDFMIEQGICTLDGLISAGYPYGEEGLPNPLPEQVVENAPTCFYTTDTMDYFGSTIENFEGISDPASLCFALGDQRFDDLCRTCEGPTLFVGASSEDWCLKQIGGVFYRETCSNPSAAGSTGDYGYTSAVGNYVLAEYDSLLRFAPLFSGEQEVQVDDVRINYLAVPQNPPSKIGLRGGISAQVGDPNTDEGRIVWRQFSLQDLKTISPKTMDQHLRDNTIPSELAHWPIYRKGRVIYLELKVSDIGGDALFSGAVVKASLAGTMRY